MPTPPLEAPRPPDTCKTCRFYRADWINQDISPTLAALGLRTSPWFIKKTADDVKAENGRCNIRAPQGNQGFGQVNEQAYCFEWEGELQSLKEMTGNA